MTSLSLCRMHLCYSCDIAVANFEQHLSFQNKWLNREVKWLKTRQSWSQMVVTTWQQSMHVGSALFQCSAIMENTSGEYILCGYLSRTRISDTMLLCFKSSYGQRWCRRRLLVQFSALPIFLYLLIFFHFYLSPGLAGKCSQSEWKGAKQKQLSAGKRSKKNKKGGGGGRSRSPRGQ